MLPRGTTYGALAGPLRADLAFAISGVLPFTIPFFRAANQQLASSETEAKYKGVKARRLALLLPHGSNNASTAAGLAARLALTSTAPPWAPTTDPVAVPFNVTLVDTCAAAHV